MSRKGNGLRVFVDSNILVSAMHSAASVSRQLLLLLAKEHRLLISSYSLTEVSRVLEKRFPNKLAEWDHFLGQFDFELILTPVDFTTIDMPYIRDAKDIPILASAIIARPDVLVTGDYYFHTSEIQECFTVMTPRAFLQSFGK
ncbi:PIN domain-containing protein [Desulfotomaculum copahuensis]|uniref:Toxin n=1 Tax=Desulfotomaculum copahuensis TaxID=1838280 RepID=A0A1B7LFP5_9FIRM|nr:PIN domain-containing protein [Desulfotomaculum copahuensis]OAT82939.1 toxin [Desulfotomaculum copahuensis]